eukprot:Amastigsp_a841303_17.p6 type:complete len:106 gc:universal Amastigsp_a841303_17:1359-1042(-)
MSTSLTSPGARFSGGRSIVGWSRPHGCSSSWAKHHPLRASPAPATHRFGLPRTCRAHRGPCSSAISSMRGRTCTPIRASTSPASPSLVRQIAATCSRLLRSERPS